MTDLPLAKVLHLALITPHGQEEMPKGGNAMSLAWSVNQEDWVDACVALILCLFLYLFCVTGITLLSNVLFGVLLS